MALFKSIAFQQASGGLAGMVFSHNKGGQYVRNRSIPTNPSSSYQQTVRNAMTVLVNAWGNVLTAAQRAAWDVYASNVPITNRLGDARNVSGIAQYVRSNTPRIQAGLARVDDAPTTFDLGDFSPISVVGDASNDEVDVTFDNADAWANEDDSAMLVYVSRPQNQGVNFFKGPYRLAGTIDGDGVTPPTSPETLTSPFALTAGQVVHVQVRVSRSDGRLSGTFQSQITAA